MFERILSMRAAFASISAILLLACWQGPSTGPGKIHWDRQICEQCQMVISERQHAAQVRMPGERNAHAFDDLGCAILWLDEQLVSHGEPHHEVWVQDPTGQQWIDATNTHFDDTLSTPMAYGFRAAEHGISFDAVQTRVREAERKRRPDRSSIAGKERGNGG